MRFFSNEAKDNVDDQDTGDRTGQAVPQQRAGSPWQHGPSDSTEADRTVPIDNTDPDKIDHDKIDQDKTVPLGARPEDTDRPAGSSEPFDFDRSETAKDKDQEPLGYDDARDQDDTVRDEPTPFGKHATGTSSETSDDKSPGTSGDKLGETSGDKSGETSGDSKVDAALDDKGTFDDPKAVDEPESKSVTGPDPDPVFEPESRTEPENKSEPVTEPVTEPAPVVAEPDPEPVVTPVAAVEDKTESTISGPAPFFPTAETQALKDRWRDVQLRFVDDPKGATGDAAQLVDEAVDKLTTALRDHRGSLSKGTEETEALRVELRAYRDILDRLLGL
jgi:hypothetical protein